MDRVRSTLPKPQGRAAAVAMVALGALVTTPALAVELRDYKNDDEGKQNDVIAHGTCEAVFDGCSGAATVDCDLTKDKYTGASFRTYVRVRRVNTTTGAVTHVNYGPLYNAGSIGSTTSATYNLPALSSPNQYQSVIWQICDDGIHHPNNVACDMHTAEQIIDNGKC